LVLKAKAMITIMHDIFTLFFCRDSVINGIKVNSKKVVIFEEYKKKNYNA